MLTHPLSARLSRCERERKRHRREILAAAERLFARKGYQATTAESWDVPDAQTQQQFLELIKPRSRAARRGLVQCPAAAPTLMPTGDPQ